MPVRLIIQEGRASDVLKTFGYFRRNSILVQEVVNIIWSEKIALSFRKTSWVDPLVFLKNVFGEILGKGKGMGELRYLLENFCITMPKKTLEGRPSSVFKNSGTIFLYCLVTVKRLVS